MSTSAPEPTRLWKDPGYGKFQLLWYGQGISELGNAISLIVIPLLAVTKLNASAGQVALMATLALAINPFVLIIGAWVDRLNRKRTMIVSDFGRALFTFGIVALATAGSLAMWHLYVAGLMIGVLGVFFELAASAFLPSIVHEKSFMAANATLTNTASGAKIVGPALVGWLVAKFGPANSLTWDGVSFLVSCATVLLIRVPAPKRKKRPLGEIPKEIVEGVVYTFKKQLVRQMIGFMVYSNLFLSGFATLAVVFLFRGAGIPQKWVGPLIAFEYAGALVGGLTTTWLSRKFGAGKVLVMAAYAGPIVICLVPLTTRAMWWFYAIGTFTPGATATMFFVIGRSYLQRTVRKDTEEQGIRDLMGRVRATIRTGSNGVLPFGAALAGGLATLWGVRGAMWALAGGLLLCPLWLWRSPVWHMSNEEFGVK